MKGKNAIGTVLVSLTVLCVGCAGTVSVDDNDNAADVVSDAIEVQITGDLNSVARAGETMGVVDSFCGGFVSSEANHTMFIDGSLGMTIRVTGSQPLGLWVLCGQSNFCGETVGTNVTEFSRFWTSGSCDVFISVEEQDSQAAYSLEFIGG